MTPAQLATIKTYVNGGDATAAAFPQTPDGREALARYMNTVPPSPSLVWRADIAAVEVVSACVMAEVVALTADKANALQFLMQPGTVDATSANVRTAFGAIFAAGATLTALTALAQRPGTRLEVLLSTAVSGSRLSTAYGQQITPSDIDAARAS